MKILIDTHTLLWFVSGDTRMSLKSRNLIESRETESFISIASYWEISIKMSLGKLQLDMTLDTFIQRRLKEGFQSLPIGHNHITTLTTLPFHHRDPFDRLIISQAMVENMAICTNDGYFSRYPVNTV